MTEPTGEQSVPTAVTTSTKHRQEVYAQIIRAYSKHFR